MRPTRLIPLLLVLVIVPTVVSFVSAAPAGAAPAPDVQATCYATGCHGYDPEATGCSANAYTVAEFTTAIFGMRIELRSSPCYAYWTRGTSPNNNGFTISIESNRTTFYASRNACTPGNCVSTVWTRMVGPGYWVRSCVIYSGLVDCTPYFDTNGLTSKTPARTAADR